MLFLDYMNRIIFIQRWNYLSNIKSNYILKHMTIFLCVNKSVISWHSIIVSIFVKVLHVGLKLI